MSAPRRPLLDIINEMNRDGLFEDEDVEYVFNNLQRLLLTEIRSLNEGDLTALIDILMQLEILRDDEGNDVPESEMNQYYVNVLGISHEFIQRMYYLYETRKEAKGQLLTLVYTLGSVFFFVFALSWLFIANSWLGYPEDGKHSEM